MTDLNFIVSQDYVVPIVTRQLCAWRPASDPLLLCNWLVSSHLYATNSTGVVQVNMSLDYGKYR